jgi:hypothetical protein
MSITAQKANSFERSPSLALPKHMARSICNHRRLAALQSLPRFLRDSCFGSFFGLERFASFALGQRRTAMDFGVTSAEKQAFGLNFRRFPDPDSVLARPAWLGLKLTSAKDRFSAHQEIRNDIANQNIAGLSVEAMNRARAGKAPFREILQCFMGHDQLHQLVDARRSRDSAEEYRAWHARSLSATGSLSDSDIDKFKRRFSGLSLPAHWKNVSAGDAVGFFGNLGWNPAQAAGLAANVRAESGFNPNAVGDNGAAYGIAQWH